MIKEYIATGKTVEAAIAAARAGLRAPDKFSLDVHTEILEYPRKKILGLFGGADAKVRAYYDDGVSEKKQKNKKQKPKKQNNQQQAKAPQKQQPRKAEPKKENKPAPKKEAAKSPVKQEETKAEVKRDFPESVDLEYAKSYLAEIVKGLEIDDAKLDASYSEGAPTR